MLAPQERNPGTQRDKGKACPVVSAAGATRAAEGRAGPGHVLADGSFGRGANQLTCLCCLPGAHRRNLTVYLPFPNYHGV